MSTRKKLFSGIFVLAVLGAGVLIVQQANRGSRAESQKTASAVPVTVAAVVAKTMPVRLVAIGNVEPFTTVSIKARVDGQLLSVKFKEGDEVRQGAVLFEIDSRPFAASLRQAQANLLKDKALLDRATEQEKRYKDLLAKNFISPDAYEQVRTNTATAAATVSADEAAIENAKLSLEYSTTPIRWSSSIKSFRCTHRFRCPNRILPTFASIRPTESSRYRRASPIPRIRWRPASSPSSTTVPMRPPARSSSRPSSRTPTRHCGPDSSSMSC
ncbi:MAG: efflux RND transporter periplasmic adaptor subunit [Betaproteobacteria bacterium]|nr:MAG: efflux RND transporter periplasmic adaptor subunit [Betaproteobacteria bacterium]